MRDFLASFINFLLTFQITDKCESGVRRWFLTYDDIIKVVISFDRELCYNFQLFAWMLQKHGEWCWFFPLYTTMTNKKVQNLCRACIKNENISTKKLFWLTEFGACPSRCENFASPVRQLSTQTFHLHLHNCLLIEIKLVNCEVRNKKPNHWVEHRNRCFFYAQLSSFFYFSPDDNMRFSRSFFRFSFFWYRIVLCSQPKDTTR